MKLMFIRNRNVLNTKWLVEYINTLQESRPDYEISVVCDTYKKVGSGCEFNHKVKLLNLSGKDKNPLRDLYHKIRCKVTPAWFRYKKLIKKEKPDIIICYFPTDLFNVTMFQKHNIPIIMMLHGTPDTVLGKYRDCKLGDLYQHIRKEFYPLRKLHQCGFKQVSVYQTLLKSFIPMVPSEFNPQKIVSIPNMVKQLTAEQYADLSTEKKKIIYIARIERDGKRQHRLVEAFGKIAKDFPEWVVEFWGLHKYPKYEEEIYNIARNNKIQDRVFIRGYSNNVLEVYQSADIHAFPSRYEGFGLAIVDGQAAGLPTIGFIDAPAVNELIIDGHNGFLADGVDDFAEKLAELMRNQELRIKFGRNAIEDVKQYSPQNVAKMWIELIDETIKESKHA